MLLYNPSTSEGKRLAKFPLYVELASGGVRQKDALSLDDWASLGWYPYTVEKTPDGKVPVPPWSYEDNGDGTYTKKPTSYEDAPVPEPEPTPLLRKEFVPLLTGEEKQDILLKATQSPDIANIAVLVLTSDIIDHADAEVLFPALVAAGIFTRARADELLALIP